MLLCTNVHLIFRIPFPRPFLRMWALAASVCKESLFSKRPHWQLKRPLYTEHKSGSWGVGLDRFM